VKPEILPVCLFVSTAVSTDTPRSARPFEDCLGAALTRQPGRVILVDVDTTLGQVGFE
jgi:hypothetical protein